VDMQEFNKDVKEFVNDCNVRVEDDYTYEWWYQRTKGGFRYCETST
jgi:hypothetical protein